MKREKAIAQLRDLIRDRRSFLDKSEPNSVFQDDIDALEYAVNHLQNHVQSMPCHHGEGVTVRPDGVHELSPHAYKLTQKLRNVTVEVLTCEKCGDVSIAGYRQDDTEEVTDDV